ncbi:MAG: polar amino acid ABC transporter permease [Betaproteobacteria bacterium]
MDKSTFDFILTWTPYLLEGFIWNLIIAVMAVALGSCIGFYLAYLRITKIGRTKRIADFISKFFRNIPTLAFMFYAAFVIPKEITLWDGFVVQFPYWIKASIGLSASSIGFTSQSMMVAFLAWKKKDYKSTLLFFPTWSNSFIITFVASSTASLVGVSEIVSRANFLIAATGTHVMIPVYIYSGLFFVISSLFIMELIKRFKNTPFIEGIPEKLAMKYPQFQT